MYVKSGKRVVAAALILPLAIMVVEAALLLLGELQSYRQLKQSRDFAYITSHVGFLASAVLPREVMMTTHFQLQKSEGKRRDMLAARAGTDITVARLLELLRDIAAERPDVAAIRTAVLERQEKLLRLRDLIDGGSNATPVSLRDSLRPYSLSLIELVALLRFEMHDPESSRLLHLFLDLLYTNGAALDLGFYGGNYLGGQGLPPTEAPKLSRAAALLAGDARRLQTYPEASDIRAFLDFQETPEGRWLTSMTADIEAMRIAPARELLRPWRIAKEAQLAALAGDIDEAGDRIRAIGDTLAAKAQLQFWVLLGTSLMLIGLVLAVVALAIKSIRLSGQLMQERERLIGELHMAAQTDPLTGLLNRRGFEHAVAAKIQARAGGGKPAAIVLFDLDRFKHVNDTYGHDVGDMVLRHAAMVAKARVRMGDLIARHGGEEFIAFLPETSLAEACAVADMMRRAIEASEIPVKDNQHRLRVTASFGCALLAARDGRADIGHSVKRADLALYAAKASGRNRVVDETEIETVGSFLQAASA